MKETLMALCAFTSILISCNDAERDTLENEPVETQEISTPEVVTEAPPVIGPEGAEYSLYKANPSPEFGNAALGLKKQDNHADGKMHFQFVVNNYELGVPTDDAETRGCANSAKGQHIHYIMNNAPYKAHYTADIEEEVPAGKNILLAFLSRSYHESIKNDKAAVIAEVYSGDSDSTLGPDIDIENDPILFYSRPKGSYKSSDGSKILLDFYLKNVELGSDGYRVRAKINGEEWILNEWSAFFIEGLGVGTHTVQLELIDSTGAMVPGAFNDSGNREFTITAD